MAHGADPTLMFDWCLLSNTRPSSAELSPAQIVCLCAPHNISTALRNDNEKATEGGVEVRPCRGRGGTPLVC
jgi:hypothetical protein